MSHIVRYCSIWIVLLITFYSVIFMQYLIWSLSLYTLVSLGDTPLHAAACNGAVDCLLMLLQYGIDPRSTNTKGDTTTHLSSFHSPSLSFTLPLSIFLSIFHYPSLYLSCSLSSILARPSSLSFFHFVYFSHFLSPTFSLLPSLSFSLSFSFSPLFPFSPSFSLFLYTSSFHFRTEGHWSCNSE